MKPEHCTLQTLTLRTKIYTKLSQNKSLISIFALEKYYTNTYYNARFWLKLWTQDDCNSVLSCWGVQLQSKIAVTMRNSFKQETWIKAVYGHAMQHGWVIAFILKIAFWPQCEILKVLFSYFYHLWINMSKWGGCRQKVFWDMREKYEAW